MTGNGEEPTPQDFIMPNEPRRSRKIMKFIGITFLVLVIVSGIIAANAPPRPHAIVGTWEFAEASEIHQGEIWFDSWIEVYFADGTGVLNVDGHIERFAWAVEDSQIAWVYNFDNGDLENIGHVMNFRECGHELSHTVK